MIEDFLPCAIVVPSLNRPQRIRPLIENIEMATPEPHIILFCVSDDDSKEQLERLGYWYLDDSGSEDKRYVTRMNKLVRHVGTAKTIFFGSDDVVFHPGWLTEATKVMEHGYELVVVNDMHNPNGTASLITTDYANRAVFDSPGDVFHGGYHHNFADNEQFFTAYMRNKYAKAPLSVVEHLHPIFRSSNAIPWDDTYAGAQSGWAHDEALFQNRAKMIEEALR